MNGLNDSEQAAGQHQKHDRDGHGKSLSFFDFCVCCRDSMRAPRKRFSTEIPYFKGVARMCGSVSPTHQSIIGKETCLNL